MTTTQAIIKVRSDTNGTIAEYTRDLFELIHENVADIFVGIMMYNCLIDQLISFWDCVN